jgi:type-F conjugative transfer system pilin assembly protein TrbC
LGKWEGVSIPGGGFWIFDLEETPLLHLLIFLFLVPVSLKAGCGQHSFSCPVDPTFLKEAEAFSKNSLEKVESLLQTENFKSFLADIKSTPKNLNQPDTSSTLYIFVSFSLGEKALLNLVQEAKPYGATLILRGFKDTSLRKTVAALHKIILATGQGVMIDPELFSTFKVTTVPTFVLATSTMHDRLQGHVSPQHVLETFSREGDLKAEAQALLNQKRIQ